MKYKCNDCGCDNDASLSASNTIRRNDLCPDCWENRNWIVKNVKLIGMDNFKKVQRKMTGRNFKAKGFIEKLKKEFPEKK